jgi:hypothetical protein
MYKAVIKKPYNPNGRTQGKQNQLNKTNFIGTAVDFLRMSGLTHYQPPVAVALGWMLQSGRWILSPIFVQERKGDALINEAKVEALRKLTSDPLASIDLGLVRLVLYSSTEMERPVGFNYREPWLMNAGILEQLTFEEAKEHKKSNMLPLRVRHIDAMRRRTCASIGEAIIIDLDSSFPNQPGCGVGDAIDRLVVNNFEVPISACIA